MMIYNIFLLENKRVLKVLILKTFAKENHNQENHKSEVFAFLNFLKKSCTHFDTIYMEHSSCVTYESKNKNKNTYRAELSCNKHTKSTTKSRTGRGSSNK